MSKGLGNTQLSVLNLLLKNRPKWLSTEEIALALCGEVTTNSRHRVTKALQRMPPELGIVISKIGKPCEGGRGKVAGWQRVACWQAAKADTKIINDALQRLKEMS
ncbi:MAG: hypothetical protein KGO53_15225 [Alphaproteobacteria bacterium]|nr:hypothetical protein [Alphaproteobacteria bacterium]